VSSAPHILIAGAGAVGQAYGRHLRLGGGRVAFLVKPKYAEEAFSGYAMYALNTRAGKRREPVRFEGFEVVTDLAAVAAQRWDQVWLCLSSTALRGGTWLADLCGAIGDATLVSLTPALDDHAFVTARYPADRVVSGMINMISYQAPLAGVGSTVGSSAGEVVPTPGVAYYRPPGKNPFSGPADARVLGVVAALAAGGWKAKRVPDAARPANFGSAMMMPTLVALEASDWSFARLRQSPHLKTAMAASREAMKVVAAYRGESQPFSRVALRPWVIRLLTRLAPLALPLDIETYLGYHFSKVGDQTAFMLKGYTVLGAERGVATPALAELLEVLERTRAALPSAQAK